MTADPRPEPLTPAHCDVKGMPSMLLDVDRLIESDTAMMANDSEFRAAFYLWARSWKQSPAGSLPNDDRILASLSGMGERWPKVRDVALRGWVLCSDGRLYHPVVVEKVILASEGRQKNKDRTEAARQARAARRPGAQVSHGATTDDVTSSVTENVAAHATGSKYKVEVEASYPSDTQPAACAGTLTKADKGPRGTRLPEAWQPSAEDVAYAEQQGLDPNREAAKFRNHWLSQGGKGACKIDWRRTWQNWCLESADRKQRRTGPQLAATNERPQPTLPALFDPPEAWLHLTAESETDSKGVTHPVVNGHYLEVAVRSACEAAGIHDPAYRPDVQTVARWLQDGFDVEHIRAAIRRVASRTGYAPKSSLTYFDRPVRETPRDRMRA